MFKASPFILHTENKQFIRIYFLTGNDLETSEVLYFSCFALKQKNALLNAKIRSISIIAKTIVREKGIVNKLFKRRTILCILVFKSSLAFGEKLDGLQNMDNVQCLLSLYLHCRILVKSFIALTSYFRLSLQIYCNTNKFK